MAHVRNYFIRGNKYIKKLVMILKIMKMATESQLLGIYWFASWVIAQVENIIRCTIMFHCYDSSTNAKRIGK